MLAQTYEKYQEKMSQISICCMAVSYTHLDVYKRQHIILFMQVRFSIFIIPDSIDFHKTGSTEQLKSIF